MYYQSLPAIAMDPPSEFLTLLASQEAREKTLSQRRAFQEAIRVFNLVVNFFTTPGAQGSVLYGVSPFEKGVVVPYSQFVGEERDLFNILGDLFPMIEEVMPKILSGLTGCSVAAGNDAFFVTLRPVSQSKAERAIKLHLERQRTQFPPPTFSTWNGFPAERNCAALPPPLYQNWGPRPGLAASVPILPQIPEETHDDDGKPPPAASCENRPAEEASEPRPMSEKEPSSTERSDEDELDEDDSTPETGDPSPREELYLKEKKLLSHLRKVWRSGPVVDFFHQWIKKVKLPERVLSKLTFSNDPFHLPKQEHDGNLNAFYAFAGEKALLRFEQDYLKMRINQAPKRTTTVNNSSPNGTSWYEDPFFYFFDKVLCRDSEFDRVLEELNSLRWKEGEYRVNMQKYVVYNLIADKSSQIDKRKQALDQFFYVTCLEYFNRIRSKNTPEYKQLLEEHRRWISTKTSLTPGENPWGNCYRNGEPWKKDLCSLQWFDVIDDEYGFFVAKFLLDGNFNTEVNLSYNQLAREGKEHELQAARYGNTIKYSSNTRALHGYSLAVASLVFQRDERLRVLTCQEHKAWASSVVIDREFQVRPPDWAAPCPHDV